MSENIDVNDRLDDLPEYETTGALYPTPEQSILRMAVEQGLTREQLKMWEYFNYDRLTFVEIGKKMHVSKQAVAQRLSRIESKLIKWIENHQEIYKALKENEEGTEE